MTYTTALSPWRQIHLSAFNNAAGVHVGELDAGGLSQVADGRDKTGVSVGVALKAALNGRSWVCLCDGKGQRGRDPTSCKMLIQKRESAETTILRRPTPDLFFEIAEGALAWVRIRQSALFV